LPINAAARSLAWRRVPRCKPSGSGLSLNRLRLPHGTQFPRKLHFTMQPNSMQPDRFGDCLGLVTSPFDVHAGNSFVARNDKLVPLCSDINLSWFKRGNAASADDAGAVPSDDSVPRRHGGGVRGTGARRGGRRASRRACRVRLCAPIPERRQVGAPTVHSVAGLLALRRPQKRVAIVSLSASRPAPLPMALASA
jgi:hypothetical protein